MSGKSYLGTMCIGVAETGVEGLKTIIPEAAISNWYEYYRYNGLNCAAIRVISRGGINAQNRTCN